MDKVPGALSHLRGLMGLICGSRGRSLECWFTKCKIGDSIYLVRHLFNSLACSVFSQKAKVICKMDIGRDVLNELSLVPPLLVFRIRFRRSRLETYIFPILPEWQNHWISLLAPLVMIRPKCRVWHWEVRLFTRIFFLLTCLGVYFVA